MCVGFGFECGREDAVGAVGDLDVCVGVGVDERDPRGAEFDGMGLVAGGVDELG